MKKLKDWYFLNLVVSGVLIFVLSGCATTPKPINTPFNEADLLPYANPGTATITGNAFMKTMGGDVKFAAGNELRLVPLTPYMQERFQKAVLNQERIENPNPAMDKYVRRTIVDGHGNFQFKSVPAGEYVILTNIYWQIPNTNSFGAKMQATGGIAYAIVKVANGETVNAVVTR